MRIITDPTIEFDEKERTWLQLLKNEICNSYSCGNCVNCPFYEDKFDDCNLQKFFSNLAKMSNCEDEE